MRDTSEEAFQVQVRVFSRMSPQERFQRGLQMIADGRRIVDNRLREQMPDSTYAERLAKRFELIYREDLSPEVLSACLEGIKNYWQGREAEAEIDASL